jgi:hypothetical protein
MSNLDSIRGRFGFGRAFPSAPVIILAAILLVSCGREMSSGLPSLPPDVPLSCLPANGRDWTGNARILQPWGKSQWEAVVRAAEHAPRLARDFGFNAVILLPPEAHNAITGPAEHITEAQFVDALTAFRAQGFRILIYSSIMHCGHAPVWQDGTLERTHPEWSQRGPKGEPIRIYGADWLCPSTGALAYTLDYTAGLVRRYDPDLIMLDNSEFYMTESGIGCYCSGCAAAFRSYLRRRFGREIEGRSTSTILLPREDGFLYDLWLAWRNRVWGEANERFREALRRIKPGLAVISNTQYLRPGPDLATDLIYDHEDAVLSESVGLTMDGMIDKLLLGRALAEGKPLWNYLGTFKEDDNNLLVAPDAIAMNVSTAYACGAQPWIVFYGFVEKPEANRASLERLAGVLAWHGARESPGAGLEPFAPVLSLISLASRNHRRSPPVPGHLTPLRRQGVCSWIIEEKMVEEGLPAACRILLVEDAPCLSDRAVRAIAKFVRSGGVVLASPETGIADELNRLRPRAALWEKLGLSGPPDQPVKIGRGEALAWKSPEGWRGLGDRLTQARFSTSAGGPGSLIPYRDARGDFVVYVCSEGPLPANLKITAPGNRPGRSIVCVNAEPTPSLVSF